MIAAGVIYLSLPLSRSKQPKTIEKISAEEETNQKMDETLEGNILYRIELDQIETSEGWFSLADEVTWLADGQIIDASGRFLGQNVELTQNQNGQVTQVQTSQNLSVPNRLRILLAADVSGDNYIHNDAVVSCQKAFWSIQDGVVQAYPPGAEIKPEPTARRTIFYPSQEGCALTLTTSKGTTSYLGQLEITTEESGYSIINEIPIETYLKGVVPSEMPGSYGIQAAMVQAVCARSYVYTQWMASEKYAVWGAQVDDSTKCQVYGGCNEYSDSSTGVEATWGQVLTYHGAVISTNYFSTSCGYTANGQEVWGGAIQQPYQQGGPQYTQGEYGDLSEEENFYAFITNGEVKAFDAHSPWFRWTAMVNREALQENADHFLAAAEKVKLVDGDQLVETKVSSIGSLEDVFVYDRSSTGMAKSLLLVGSQESVVVEGAANIRTLLGNQSVKLANGEETSVYALLPSAFISLEKIKDTEENLVSIKIYGGGYGHGVGMSQNGVKGMLDAGYTYEEILAHYFPGTELMNL